MTCLARRHRHVAFECILRDRRIELEVLNQVSCDAVLLQLGAHLSKERYAYAARKSLRSSDTVTISSRRTYLVQALMILRSFHSQTVSRKVSRSLAASLDSYENIS